MPETLKQGTRLMTVATPLGPDKLLLLGFEGTEQISGLFRFRLELMAPNATKIQFDQLLGKEMVISLLVEKASSGNKGEYRYIRGICSRFSQGRRDDQFTYYRAEIVPQLWLTTRTAQSRIFQQKSVPDILKDVLKGLNVSYQIDGTFQKREYCVQYRETDFNFVSRLMEEEGIFYFFRHTEQKHEMVIANASRVFEDVPGVSKVPWGVVEGANREFAHIHDWEKLQEIRSGKYMLWDSTFQLPCNNLEATKNTLASVVVGKVTHKLEVGGNGEFEIYDYPGAYAQRVDGINKSGGEQGAELGQIPQDGTRTVELRMQAETAAGVVIQGSSNCNNFGSGKKFSLEKHFDGEGKYILTSVTHSARTGTAYYSGDDEDFVYSNTFTCIPDALPFRPQRTTPKPSITGAQTAFVVGPAGEEIFTDKYGRVKVQFPWDRASQANADSSCWLRVGTSWAGKKWGAIHIPRIGQEVIVQFLEGDPDAPIIIGSVYNAETMPPYTLPDEKTKSTLKSNSSLGGGGFNEIRFEDKKGEEQLFIHAEKQRDMRVKKDNLEWIGNNEHLIVIKDRHKNVKGDEHNEIGGCRNEKVGETQSLSAGGYVLQKAGMNAALHAGTDIHVKGGTNVVVEAGVMLTLKGPGGFIVIDAGGVTIMGSMVKINSGGGAGTGSGCSPTSPTAALEADKADPGEKTPVPKGRKKPKPVTYSPTAVALQSAAQSGTPFCAVCAAAAAAGQ